MNAVGWCFVEASISTRSEHSDAWTKVVKRIVTNEQLQIRPEDLDA